MQFSDEQQAIINAHVLDTQVVQSGAGVGKTSTIVGRVAQLLQSDDERPLLLLSHTNSACTTLRSALEKSGVPNESPRVHILTMHAFAATVVGDSGSTLDTCIANAAEMIEQAPEACEVFVSSTGGIRHVFVDEAQDLSADQLRLLHAIVRYGAGSNARLFGATIVGDERQAIYGFSGADTVGFARLAKQMRDHGIHVVNRPLSVSFRCSAPVVRACNFVTDGVFSSPPLRALAPDADLAHQTVEIRMVSPHCQDAFIVSAVRGIAAQYGPANVMVLSRTNRRAAIVGATLRKHGISAVRNEQEFEDAGHGGVRVMTIHTAKGTEAKVVIACELLRSDLEDDGSDPLTARTQSCALVYTAISRTIDRFIGVWTCDPARPCPPSEALKPAGLSQADCPITVGAVRPSESATVQEHLLLPQPAPRPARAPRTVRAVLQAAKACPAAWLESIGAVHHVQNLDVERENNEADCRCVAVAKLLGLPPPASLVALASASALTFHGDDTVARRLLSTVENWRQSSSDGVVDLGLAHSCMDWAVGSFRTSGPMAPSGPGASVPSEAERHTATAIAMQVGRPIHADGNHGRVGRVARPLQEWYQFRGPAGGTPVVVTLCDDVHGDATIVEGLLIAAKLARQAGRSRTRVHTAVVNVCQGTVTRCGVDAATVEASFEDMVPP